MAGLLEIYELNRDLIRSGKGQNGVKFTDLRFVPLGGVGEIGINVYLYGLDGRWMMVDLGHRLRRRPPARGRYRPARPALHRGAARPSRRAHPDPRARGPCRRRTLSLAAPRLPDLVHAVHRRRAARQARRDRLRPRRADPHRRAGPAVRGRRHALPLPPRHPLDPRRQRAGDRTPPSAGSSTPATGSSTRRRWSGPRTDVDALEDLGKGGVLAMLCDSTNVLSPGTSGSEAEVRDSLIELIARQPQPRGADQLLLQHRPPGDAPCSPPGPPGASCSSSAARCAG